MKSALIVDDTKNIRNMLITCLELKNFNVTEASNGFQAIEIVKKMPFDIAFIDIKMPELSGTEVLRQIREMGINFPIVMMTAFPTIKNAVDCTKLGAVAYLQKPFSADKIGSVVDSLMNFTDDESNSDSKIKNIKRKIEEKDYDEAIYMAKKLIGNDPSYAEAYHVLGDVYACLGDMASAEKFYKAAEVFSIGN